VRAAGLQPGGEAGGVAGRLLFFVSLVNVLNTMDRLVISAMLEPIRHEFHLTDAQLGILSGIAYSGAAALTAVPAGLMADRFSRKAVLAVALSVWSGFTALCGAASGYLTLLLFRSGVGASEAASPATSLAMITDAYPKERQAGAIGVFYASGALGALVGVASAGWIATHYGWRWAFFAVSAPALVILPILLAALKEPPRRAAGRPSIRTSLADVACALASNRELAWLLVATTLSPLTITALFSWSVSLLIRTHGLGLTQAASVVAACSGLFSPIGQFIGGRLGDWLTERRPGAEMWVPAIAILASAALGVLAALTSEAAVSVAAMCGFAVISMCYLGPAFARVTEIAPEGPRATIFAIVTVLGNIVGTGGGPYLVGKISDLIGGPHSLPPAIALAMLAAFAPAAIYAGLARHLTARAVGARPSGDLEPIQGKPGFSKAHIEGQP
jgi:predicted MFS family arabinose efflux permease